MKKSAVILGMFLLAFVIFGCSKREGAMEQPPENMTMDELGMINVAAPEAKPAEPQAVAEEYKTAAPQAAVSPRGADTFTPASPEANKVAQLPVVQTASSGVTKPDPIDIQTALKNAGFYSGKIDGKIGPLTVKAISEFQKANKLKADGKVGSKTWGLLSRHLN